MINISIQTKTITTTKEVKFIEIEDGQILLNKSATFPVRLLDVDGKLIDVKFIILEGEDYTNWGDEDDYVVDFILSELGMSK
jgi:hypothetical protein